MADKQYEYIDRDRPVDIGGVVGLEGSVEWECFPP